MKDFFKEERENFIKLLHCFVTYGFEAWILMEIRYEYKQPK
jgi:hypothetical protein